MDNFEIYLSPPAHHLTLGNGKTLVMGIEAFEWKYLNPDFKIFSNYNLSFADEYYNISECMEILKHNENILLLIDEFSVLAHAYNWNDKDVKNLIPFFKQLRKKKVYIKAVTQVGGDIPKFVRDLQIDLKFVRKYHKDKTLCGKTRNENCIYNEHYYKVTPVTRINYDDYYEYTELEKFYSTHLIQLFESGKVKVIEDYFYKCYDSDEVIFKDD